MPFNAVAQALRANGHRLFFLSLYDEMAKRSLEIDFLITEGYPDAAMKARVSPIEVKSSSTYTTSSLDKLRSRFQKCIGTEYVLRLSSSRWRVTGCSCRSTWPFASRLPTLGDIQYDLYLGLT